MTKEEIFEKNAKEGMTIFNSHNFGLAYPSLLTVVYKSMSDYSASLIKENEELKTKVRELEEKLIWIDDQDESL